MARDNSPIVKQSRREGYALHPKAHKVLARKSGIPGQHAHGRPGEKIPEMTAAHVASISERYIELYEHLLGKKFIKSDTTNIQERIYKNVSEYLRSLL